MINKKLFEHLCEFFLLRSKNLVGAKESAELDFFGSFFGNGKKNKEHIGFYRKTTANIGMLVSLQEALKNCGILEMYL